MEISEAALGFPLQVSVPTFHFTLIGLEIFRLLTRVPVKSVENGKKANGKETVAANVSWSYLAQTGLV